jgi:hypothetical protein
MKRTLVMLFVGVLIFTAVLAKLLTTEVYGDRGRGEINLFTIHEISIGTGTVLTQPVPLQRQDAYAIDLPYRWTACGSAQRCPSGNPARVEARLMSSDGSLLADTIEVLGDTRSPIWAQPTGDGSFLENGSAAFHPIRLPPHATGTVLLSLTRVDREPGELVLFASDQVASPAAQSRPTMVERPTEILDLQTEYGAPRPALAKIPTYVSRIQDLAPPWLPFPLPELLLVCVVAIGIFLYGKLLFAPAGDSDAEALSPLKFRTK